MIAQAKRLPLNSIVALILIFISILGIIATFFMDLDSEVLLIPRIAIGLVGVGGILIVQKDLRRPEKVPELDRTNVIPYLIGVVVAIWLYSQAVLNIGLAASTFAFLIVWWAWISYRDARVSGNPRDFFPRILVFLGIAVVVTGAMYVLFTLLLNIHLPGTPLP